MGAGHSSAARPGAGERTVQVDVRRLGAAGSARNALSAGSAGAGRRWAEPYGTAQVLGGAGRPRGFVQARCALARARAVPKQPLGRHPRVEQTDKVEDRVERGQHGQRT